MEQAAAEVLASQFPRPPSQDIALGRAILSRRIEQIEDITADPHRAFVPPGQGSVMAVPLLRDGAPLGAIAIGRRERGPFSSNQVTLLQMFAEQAVIAITSAGTHRELQERTAALARRNSEYGERIEHQAATSDVLKTMSASPGDPQPAFDLIVQRARDLCDAYGVTITEFDGTLVHRRASTGLSDDPEIRAAIMAHFPYPPTRNTIHGRTILDRRITRVDDNETEPGLRPIDRIVTARSAVCIPLIRGDNVIGTLGMGSRELGGFSDSQVELLKTFAEQAVIAITSSETYRALQARTADLQQSLEYQTATSDVLKVISRSTFDLQPVLAMVAETAARLCVADQGG
jgi:GAF domain-containing protein